MASDLSHAHLIQLHSTTHGEVLRPPLIWIGNRAWIRLKSIVAAATIQIMKLAWVTYLGTLSRINAILIPQILAHPPILAQCKVHHPWALFHESTVLVNKLHNNAVINKQCLLACVCDHIICIPYFLDQTPRLLIEGGSYSRAAFINLKQHLLVTLTK